MLQVPHFTDFLIVACCFLCLMSFLTRTACDMISHDITTTILVTLEFPELWTNLNLRLQKEARD